MITSHILDTSIGKPAAGIAASLFFLENNEWTEVTKSKSNNDGRINEWLSKEPAATLVRHVNGGMARIVKLKGGAVGVRARAWTVVSYTSFPLAWPVGRAPVPRPIEEAFPASSQIR